MDAERTVTEYYRSIDAGEYDALATVLARGFVHRRPDRTIDGRETFVRFMREERPRTDTTHEIDTRFVAIPDDTGNDDRDNDNDDGLDIAVEGRLCDADGNALFGFIDRHTLTDGAIASITTYTR